MKRASLKKISGHIVIIAGILAIALSLVGCPSPTSQSTSPVSTSYPEIVIDTYKPTGPHVVAQFQFMELFSASGVTSSQDPWSFPTTGALAYDILGSNPDPSMIGYAYIDYKPALPLASGTVLYIRISGGNSLDTPAQDALLTGAYAITVLTSPPTTYTFFGSVNSTDAPYAAGNNLPNSGGVPTNPAVITLGGALNRYVLAGAVEWVQVTLP